VLLLVLCPLALASAGLRGVRRTRRTPVRCRGPEADAVTVAQPSVAEAKPSKWYRLGGKRAKVVEAVNEAIRYAVSSADRNPGGRRSKVVEAVRDAMGAFGSAVDGFTERTTQEREPSDEDPAASSDEDMQGSMKNLLKADSKLDFMQGLRRFRETSEEFMNQAASSWQARKELPSLLGPLAANLGLQNTYGLVVQDASAWKSGEDWVVPLNAWLFRRNKDRHNIRLMLCQKLLIEIRHGIKDVDEEAQKRYEERGRLIFRSIVFRGGEEKRPLEVRFGGPEGGDAWRLLPEETDSRGRLSAEVRLPAAQVQAALSRAGGTALPELQMEVRSSLPAFVDSIQEEDDEAVVPASSPLVAFASILLVSADGFGVISDIDDTVKVTEVFLGKDQIVRNTFFEEFRAVQGMADLFTGWAEQVPKLSFEFVSNSPPELLEPLRAFLREKGFPGAPLHLRPLNGPLRAEHKRRSIERILAQFPWRRFVLIGDSGEGDAALYVDIYRRFPGRIVKVIIREVDVSRRVDDAVFDGLARDEWQVFREASEVEVSWTTAAATASG